MKRSHSLYKPPTFVLIGLGLFFFINVMSGEAAASDRANHPLAPPDRSSPRATLRTFLDRMNRAVAAFKRGRKEEARSLAAPAVQCLNLAEEAPALRRFIALDAALYLKEILDRIEIPPDSDIPDAKTVQTERLTRWTIPHTEITLAHAEEKSSRGRFLFTNHTVRNSGGFYHKVKHLPYQAGTGQGAFYEQIVSSTGWIIPHGFLAALPEWTKATLWGQAVWQWIGLALYFLIVPAAFFLIHRQGGKAVDWVDQKFGVNVKRWVFGFFLPGALIIFSWVGLWITPNCLHIINSDVFIPLAYIFTGLIYIGALWFIGVVLNAIADLVIAVGGFAAGDMDVQLIRLGFDILTIAVVIVAVIHMGDRIGLPIYSLVAGLGIGGLAVALAGREALSNVIGAIMIILDRPFKIGDYISLSDGERGVVAGVGFRSTCIQTRDDILISIPNSIIANAKMINESAPEPLSRVRVKVGTAYGSDLSKVERVLLSVAEDDELTVSEPSPEIRFRQFGESALEFELLCWIHLPEERGRTIHRLNWAIYEAFQREGIEIPFPQRDVHIRSAQ